MCVLICEIESDYDGVYDLDCVYRMMFWLIAEVSGVVGSCFGSRAVVLSVFLSLKDYSL